MRLLERSSGSISPRFSHQGDLVIRVARRLTSFGGRSKLQAPSSSTRTAEGPECVSGNLLQSRGVERTGMGKLPHGSRRPYRRSKSTKSSCQAANVGS
jgi:hypothetical protein